MGVVENVIKWDVVEEVIKIAGVKMERWPGPEDY